MTQKPLSLVLCAATLAASLVVSPSLFAQGAQNKAAAEALYQEGLKLMSQNKFDEACPKFVESRHLDEANGTLLALATCFEKAGKTASAWAQYKELAFLFKKGNDLERARACEDKAAALEGRLSKLQVSVAVDTPGLVVRRDNEEVGKAVMGTAIPVDPGSHIIEATAPGYRVWQTTVNVGGERDLQTVTIPGLIVDPNASGLGGGGSRLPAYVVGGVGLASLAVGGIFGGLAISDKSAVEKDCPGKVCTTQKGKDELSSANTKALISTITVPVGVAALGTGVVLYLLSSGHSPKKDDAPKSAQIVPTFGPGNAGLTVLGSF